MVLTLYYSFLAHWIKSEDLVAVSDEVIYWREGAWTRQGQWAEIETQPWDSPTQGEEEGLACTWPQVRIRVTRTQGEAKLDC